MIATTRTASIAPGKSTSALAYIREMAGYMKSTYDVDYEVLIPIAAIQIALRCQPAIRIWLLSTR
jgi:hypothetical protein